jgi:hypothetical protein
VIIPAKRDSLKNSEATKDLSKWDKFKESNNGIASTDEALNVNARILIKE